MVPVAAKGTITQGLTASDPFRPSMSSIIKVPQPWKTEPLAMGQVFEHLSLIIWAF